MIFTLAWKEVREHSSIWLAMVVMTVLMGWGMTKILPQAGPMSIGVPDLIILGLAVTYGVVCGAMMFAGEHENGTLVFLDIFHGRRQSLWCNKFAIGIVLVLTQALAVAGLLWLVGQMAPQWVRAMLGGLMRQPGNVVVRAHPDALVWFVALPLVTLEAYAWGLLGSAMQRRVLEGAGVALGGLAPAWILTLAAPPEVGLVVRLIAMVVVLVISINVFVQQPRDLALGPTPESPTVDMEPAREHYLDKWERADERDEFLKSRRRLEQEDSAGPTGAREIDRIDAEVAPHETSADATVRAFPASASSEEPAKSPLAALRWLTWQQAAPLVLVIFVVSLLVGMLLPPAAQVLWPIATLLLGATCGCAAFAPEQRDLSYQFLASQHFPMPLIWRTKVFLWAAIALLAAIVMLLVCAAVFAVLMSPGLAANRQARINLPAGFDVPLFTQLGPALFLGVWLVYGFCLGQVFVWFFRKAILAILMTTLTAGAAVMLWMPSLMCGGMRGWQLWLPPLIMLAAGWFLVRRWAGGSILEHRNLAAFGAFAGSTFVWAALCFAYRAWEIPDVGPPMDLAAFKAEVQAQTLPAANPAGVAFRRAMGEFDPRTPNDVAWIAQMTEAAKFPTGILEAPRGDGQRPDTTTLTKCRQMIEAYRLLARRDPGRAADRLAELLALSRTLRNRSAFDSYLVGVAAETSALEGYHELVSRAKPSGALMRRILDDLNRHAAETPSPVECLKAECLISSGILNNPTVWQYIRPGNAPGDRALVGAISLSLEMPWEAERKARLWQLVWSGMFRSLEPPHWELPEPPPESRLEKNATRAILKGWIDAPDDPGRFPRVARWLDDSWLSDDRLFTPVSNLRDAATRSKFRVDSMRLAIAAAFHRLENGPPGRLEDLVPRYLPELPKDPYRGDAFRYLPEDDNPGRIWSTGPDRIDNGGLDDGAQFADSDPRWTRGGLDLITTVPQWR